MEERVSLPCPQERQPEPLPARPARWMGRLFQLVVNTSLALLLAALAWQRWGPVPERKIPPLAEVQQWNNRTCGPAAVATVLNFYARPWSAEELERDCRVSQAGSSMYDLVQTLRARRLPAEGIRSATPAGLRRVPRPFIAYLATGHFVVVEKWRGNRFMLFDPASGKTRWWSDETLHERGNGWVITIEDHSPLLALEHWVARLVHQ